MEEQAKKPVVQLVLPAEPPHIRVEMFSQPRYLSGARDLVSAVARRFGFDEGACGQIALAVDEALCNIIRHGYDRRADGKIWIMVWPIQDSSAGAGCCGDCCSSAADPLFPGDAAASRSDEPGLAECEPTGILIAIEDEAKQVDPSLIKSRDLEDIRPGGLGVFIIQSVMDAVAYQHRDTGGMRLLMAKRTDPEAARKERLEHPDLELSEPSSGSSSSEPSSGPDGSPGHTSGAHPTQERP